MVGIEVTLSDLASSDNWENAEGDNDTVTKKGKLSEVHKPGWVMGIICKTVQPSMERFWQK
jgi:hypothetical protein